MTKEEWDALGEKALVLRTCNADLTSRNQFQWPASGFIECPDWKPTKECGNGLHGLLDGYGDCCLLSSDTNAKWLIAEVVRSECIDINQKVKFPRAFVVYVGDMATAMAKMGDWQIELLIKESAKICDPGNDSTLAASGYASTLAASGNDSIAMAAGRGSIVSAGENGCFALSWYDATTNRNRIIVGYVGEDGIKANTPYRVVDGKLKEVS